MGLWDSEEVEEIEVGNEYLRDPEKGLELVARLLSTDKDYEKSINLRKLDHLLDYGLLNSLHEINLPNEMKLNQQLKKISDKLEEYKKISLLRDKTIVGIGGEFSAGKSKFINTLMNDDILPEAQMPTTSIPTYILKADECAISAYTVNDQEVDLDLQAMQALTHEFYEKYKLGFSQFIRNLVIKRDGIHYGKIAILDTPGYNKYDSSEKKSVSDERKAREQLKSADFLIWLVDIENGIIHNRDIEFIKSLELNTPALIIFNKADKKTETEARSIVTQTERLLKNMGLNIYAVTAYSSFKGEEYFGNDHIKRFLQEASSYSDRKEDIYKQFNDIIDELQEELQKMRKKMMDEKSYIGDAIFRSEDILAIKSLVKLYADACDQLGALLKCIRSVNSVSNHIQETFTSLTR